MSNEEQKPALQQTDVVRSFLQEMSKKHQCPIDQIMVGIVFNEMHIWGYRYNEGAYEKWKQLEIVSL
jgi:hypothetical protein